MPEKIKIIVADDHEFFRKGVALTVNRLKYACIIAEASNGKELLREITKEKPHIILTDIRMPEMSGIEVTREITKLYPEIKVIALSMFGDEEYLESMLDAGAQGFILKNIDKDGLDRALQVIAQDKQYFSEELLPYFTKKYSNNTETVEALKLTKREIEILQLISEGLSNQEIADKLFLSVRTVTNHRASILFKTNSKNTASLIGYSIKHNLIKY